jgi:hypothetical protein
MSETNEMNNTDVEPSEMTAAESPVEIEVQKPTERVPTAKSLTEADLLRSENLHLRAINFSKDVSILALQLQDKQREAQRANRELAEFQVSIGIKYNIDFTLYEVDTLGMIVSKRRA